jgi:hypothetical protein
MFIPKALFILWIASFITSAEALLVLSIYLSCPLNAAAKLAILDYSCSNANS